MKFAKPHGSVAWTLNLCKCTLDYHSPEGDPLLSSLAPSDVDCDREPLVLGAVPIKSELIKEVQERYGTPKVHEVVADQWRAVVESIRDADVIVVVGYSFPPEDQYGTFLVQEGLRLRTTDLSIELFEVEDRVGETCRRLCDIFGPRLRAIEFRGAVHPDALRKL